jgi:hypothetical protein
VGFAALIGAARAVALPIADNTTLPNPFAVQALAPLAGAVEAGIGVAFLLAVLLSIGSAVAVALRSRREGRGVALPAVLAVVVLVVTFVLQAVDWTVGGVAFAAGPVLAAALCLRVVRAFAGPGAGD